MKALALISGGLDSFLAVKLMQDQGVEVIGIGFESPFFGCEKSREAARRAGIPFHCIAITGPIIEILKHPRYGYGKHMNPCIDCHRLMVQEAFKLLDRFAAAFVVTGEVLGQRPKSQNLDALGSVAKAGKKGLLLRPLSSRLLKETVPEKEGWVDRSRLLDISGRSRTRQLELAKRYGQEDFFSPAGGCLLTDPGFCKRLADLKEHEGWKEEHLRLLRVGRHFRLPSGARLVSGRDKEENQELEKIALPGDYFFQAEVRPGSLVLLRMPAGGREPEPEDIAPAAAVTARYSRPGGEEEMEIELWEPGLSRPRKKVRAKPIAAEALSRLRIIPET